MLINIALHSCMDLGGIINHTEQLIGGLKDLGHEVNLFELVYADRAGSQNRSTNEIGPSGIPFSQGKGWSFPISRRLPYKTGAGLNLARQVLSDEADIVIWTVPVVPKNKIHLGNNNWPELYDLPPHVKQIAIAHDGNAKGGWPHVLAVEERLSGIACVHSCALAATSFLEVPRALIVNPQFTPIRDFPEWQHKDSGFINFQTFKAWKHVHELIESIRYMPPIKFTELRDVAGKGIEYQYMTSEDKCKPQYFHEDGTKFWDAALMNGMLHHDYWDTKKVLEMCQAARVLVDPSWSKKYSQIGGHWNRVVVDAMMNGAIPVARTKGMGDTLFKSGIHFIDLDQTESPEEYADLILEAGNMSPTNAKYYHDAHREILPMFDRTVVAQRFIDLAFGNIETVKGKHNPAITSKASDLLFEFYGVLL